MGAGSLARGPSGTPRRVRCSGSTSWASRSSAIARATTGRWPCRRRWTSGRSPCGGAADSSRRLPTGSGSPSPTPRSGSGYRPVEADQPDLRFNDGKCDPAGRFLAGSMAYDKHTGAGGLYRLDPDGTVEQLLDGVTISNGLAWTPGRRHALLHRYAAPAGGRLRLRRRDRSAVEPTAAHRLARPMRRAGRTA